MSVSPKITSSHNCEKGYISLPITYPIELPERIEVNGKTLFRKSEFHVSLMALKHLVPLIQDAGHAINADDLVHDFITFQNTMSLSDFSLTGVFRYVKRDERETIVAMVEVPRIENLFDYLRTKYATDLPTQPTHITLYTLQSEAGIGILSESQLKQDSAVIEMPDLLP